jgi:hypothetical protein
MEAHYQTKWVRLINPDVRMSHPRPSPRVCTPRLRDSVKPLCFKRGRRAGISRHSVVRF